MLAAILAAGRLAGQETWVPSVSTTTRALHGVGWNGNRFIAVGEAGTLVVSTDGNTWRPVASGTTSALHAVASGAGVTIVAGSDGTVLTSTDDETWSRRTTGTTMTLRGAAHGHGRFLTVGEGGEGLTSLDGISWSPRPIPVSSSLHGATFAYGIFVCPGTGGWALSSAGGEAFLARRTGTNTQHLHAIAYGQRQFVAVGSAGLVLGSSDGRTFAPHRATLPAGTPDLRGIGFFNGVFVAVGEQGRVLTLSDLRTWSRVDANATATLRAIASNDRMAIVVGDDGVILRSAAAPRAPAIITPPGSRTVFNNPNSQDGDAVILTVVATGSAPLSYQWTLDGTPIPGATGDVLEFPVVRREHLGDYTVTVRNAAGSTTSPVARLDLQPRPTGNQSLVDSTFTAAPFSSPPQAAAELTDGRILVGGAFEFAGPGGVQRGLAILETDGASAAGIPVPALNPGGSVRTLVRAPDDRIFLLGDFTAVDGASRRNLARLHATGTLDDGFNVPDSVSIPAGARLIPLADGGALVAGTGDGTRLLRLTSRGAVDEAFDGRIHFNGSPAVIRNAAVDSEGRILVACIDQGAQGRFARLFADGRQDTAIASSPVSTGGDWPLLAGGERGQVLFVRIPSSGTQTMVGVVGADGAPAAGTTQSVRESSFAAAAVGTDGSLYLATRAVRPTGTTREVVRIHADGGRDDSFVLSRGIDGEVAGWLPLRDGRSLVMGSFTQVDGVARPQVARLVKLNRAPAPPMVITGITPGTVSVREGEPFRLTMRAGGAPFGGVSWWSDADRFIGSVSPAYAFYGETSFEFVRHEAGTAFIAGQIRSSSSQVYSPYARIEVTPQPDPVILTPPAVAPGFPGYQVQLSVLAAGRGITYQWFRNGSAIAGATAHTWSINRAEPAAAYTVRITNARGSVTSPPLAWSAPPEEGHLRNLSVRAPGIGRDNDLLIGFALGGAGRTGTKELLVRAVGPGLIPFGVTDAVADPQFQLLRDRRVLVENNDWNPSQGIIASIGAALGAFPLPWSGSKDAAEAATLPAGAFNVRISAPNQPPGTVLAEIYDATASGTGSAQQPRLVNLSVRSQVGRGGEPLIAGFVVGGNRAVTLLLRGVGPALAAFGVADALADPRLELYREGDRVPLAANDDWGDPAGGELAAVARRVGAFALPAGSRDSALLVALPPGTYSVQLSGDRAGSGLVEVYEVP